MMFITSRRISFLSVSTGMSPVITYTQDCVQNVFILTRPDQLSTRWTMCIQTWYMRIFSESLKAWSLKIDLKLTNDCFSITLTISKWNRTLRKDKKPSLTSWRYNIHFLPKHRENEFSLIKTTKTLAFPHDYT